MQECCRSTIHVHESVHRFLGTRGLAWLRKMRSRAVLMLLLLSFTATCAGMFLFLLPKTPQDRHKTPQDRTKTPKDRPKAPQDAPRPPQDRTKTRQERSKTPMPPRDTSCTKTYSFRTIRTSGAVLLTVKCHGNSRNLCLLASGKSFNQNQSNAEGQRLQAKRRDTRDTSFSFQKRKYYNP